MKLRLNKFLAQCGVASRRAADALIEAGKVFVDGRRATLGDSIDPSSAVVSASGRRIRQDDSREHLTLAFNKPPHVITSMSDEHGRRTVADFLPRGRRLFPVGRLDAETTGLLLCTTDGALAKFLTHPGSEISRLYQVVARGSLNADTIGALGARGVKKMPDGSHSFNIILKEGKNRQVRRMCARSGLRIVSLERTQFGPIRLGKLKIGCTRDLTEPEMRELARLRAERSSV